MFSDIIRDLRLRRGLTQKELAQAVFLSPGAISQYENGKSHPSRETLDTLAQYFGVSVSYLLGTSVNAEVETLLSEEFCSGVTVAGFVRLCASTCPEDRATILKIVTSLVPSSASSLSHGKEKVCR